MKKSLNLQNLNLSCLQSVSLLLTCKKSMVYVILFTLKRFTCGSLGIPYLPHHTPRYGTFVYQRGKLLKGRVLKKCTPFPLYWLGERRKGEVLGGGARPPPAKNMSIPIVVTYRKYHSIFLLLLLLGSNSCCMDGWRYIFGSPHLWVYEHTHMGVCDEGDHTQAYLCLYRHTYIYIEKNRWTNTHIPHISIHIPHKHTYKYHKHTYTYHTHTYTCIHILHKHTFTY